MKKWANRVNIYLFKVNNRNNRKRCEAYFTSFSSNSIVDFEQVNVNWVMIKNCANM